MQNCNKVVTIVLPTYNGKRYILETINSCLNQTYRNIELIIVDDCSDDGTFDLIKDTLKDPRIIYHRNNSNLKLPASLNVGFSLAKGDYYTWISDDNYFSPNAIEKMLENLGDYDLIYSSYTLISEHGSIIDIYDTPVESLIFTCSVGACFLYKKIIHEVLKGYDEGKFRMEDYDFWLRASKKFRFKNIQFSELYFYRKHQNNLTTAIYSDPQILSRYKKDYSETFFNFFSEGIQPALSKNDMEIHLSIFFNDLTQERRFTIESYRQLNALTEHFTKLRTIIWGNTLFNSEKMIEIINLKEKNILLDIAGTLLFENLKFRNENPKLATYLSKPIFWYYKEYETLPLWFKRFGHIIKYLQKNKPLPSLFKSKNKTS